MVINLKDKTLRWKKVNAQLKKLNIKAKRYIAVDGRAKDEKGAKAKLREFKKLYGLSFKQEVPKPSGAVRIKARETSAAASLTIGTILILREMIKNNLQHVLILEDDVNFDKNFIAEFVQRERSLRKLKPYDMWYLGCGDKCGSRGIGESEHYTRPFDSPYMELDWLEKPLYVTHEDDLRLGCDKTECKRIAKGISIPEKAGGTWAYSYSLRGAKKLLAYVDSFKGKPLPTPHIDQLIQLAIKKSKKTKNPIVVYTCDPPIVWHEGGAYRKDSDIPWEM